MSILVNLRTSLDGIYPGLWNASVGLVVVLLVTVLKRVSPAWFAKLPPALQSLPAMVFAAVLSALAPLGASIGAVLASALTGGTIGGTVAVGAYHIGKRMTRKDPPEDGAVIPVTINQVGPAAFILVLCLFIPACSQKQIDSAIDVANSVIEIARVLCLADHARQANTTAMSVAGLCETPDQLAPYVPVAQDPKLMISTGPSCQ